ncbi:MAG: hypothetical protein MK207_01710 [Saprospiraceae bacterium]|nr:hypothetical protein [Saprospiraceae bacterium]
MNRDNVKRICLWSGPRNISTALMYSFAQRSDTKVYDEPLYGFYLRHSDAKVYHPGAEDVLRTMENDGDKVIDMILTSQEKPVIFFKNMTHHLLDLDRSFMKNVINVILTRDPVEMLPSFAKVIKNPTIEDVGYEKHIQLVAYLKDLNIEPIVIDSKKILLDPLQELSSLCKKIGIPFNKNMLSWKAGARPEDGVWAKFWYTNIHNSEGFQEYKPKTDPFPENLKPLLRRCKPYYKQLMELV